MTKPTVMSFDQWLRENKDLEDKLMLDGVPCNMCNGTGETECSECGHERICEDCENGIAYDSSGALRDAMRKIYDAQVKTDQEKWQAWQDSIKEVTR